ncbi:MAG: ribosome biogenesis GTPase Der [Rhodocyclaceae bacterium]|nr:ribosome biogenesis GTPase Der [Rhodocyclaceae bacterium]
MKPTIVIVGRPNVGKSMLFNRLTKSRDALVADLPGLTRDRHYGHGRGASKPFLVVDTGGFEPKVTDGILHEMAKQTLQAVAEADALLFVVDGRQGLTPQDKIIAERLRQTMRRGTGTVAAKPVPVIVAVNKAEGMDEQIVTAEFHELGLGAPVAISAAHGEGVRQLIEDMLANFPDEETEEVDPKHPKIAIIGRPNVGKSTLVNKLLGEDRVIAFDEPGTTRDSIFVPLHRHGKDYTLIDTAGIRRRGKVFEAVEKFSVIKTLQAIADCHVVILVLDARQEVSEQDAHIAGFILESGRALVVGINKWDNLDEYTRERVKSDFDRKLHFLSFAHMHTISAKDGMGLTPLFQSVDAAFAAAMAKLSTPKLTRALIAAVAAHQPPMSGPHRPKMCYAHQGGHNPPLVIVHGSGLDNVHESYIRYLEGRFMETFKLRGTPLRVELKAGANPFRDRKPAPLTKGQEDKRRRGRIRMKRKYG